jgi:hypothetical protein
LRERSAAGADARVLFTNGTTNDMVQMVVRRLPVSRRIGDMAIQHVRSLRRLLSQQQVWLPPEKPN